MVKEESHIMHKAVYGKIVLLRGYCPDCHEEALIVDGKFACCDREVQLPETASEKRMCLTIKRRRNTLTLKQRRMLVERQNNKCVYCGQDLDTFVWSERHTCYRKPSVEYDHFVPWAFEHATELPNMVVACGECNRCKSDHIFNSMEEAIIYVRQQRRLPHEREEDHVS